MYPLDSAIYYGPDGTELTLLDRLITASTTHHPPQHPPSSTQLPGTAASPPQLPPQGQQAPARRPLSIHPTPPPPSPSPSPTPAHQRYQQPARPAQPLPLSLSPTLSRPRPRPPASLSWPACFRSLARSLPAACSSSPLPNPSQLPLTTTNAHRPLPPDRPPPRPTTGREADDDLATSSRCSLTSFPSVPSSSPGPPSPVHLALSFPAAQPTQHVAAMNSQNDVSPEAMQARIQQARREAENLKDRIKRKKDELADTTRMSLCAHAHRCP